PLYPAWQEYFRTHQPPVLIAWGKNDQIFPAAGAEPYKRDLKTLEYHLLDAGHFALETNGDEIAKLMREFLGKHVGKKEVQEDKRRRESNWRQPGPNQSLQQTAAAVLVSRSIRALGAAALLSFSVRPMEILLRRGCLGGPPIN